MKVNLKIFNPVWSVDTADDWGLEAQSVDLDSALQQPFKIACVPAQFNDPSNFNYGGFQQSQLSIDLSQFDLVLISDIEQDRYSWIQRWIQQSGIRQHLLAIGATHAPEQDYDRSTTVLRPWWMYNLMRMNTFNEHLQDHKLFWFDALLGARRPHRDYVMLSFQNNPELLEKSIVTYRNGFPGEIIDSQTEKVHACFPDINMTWPYVSPNLDHAWELKDALGKITGPIQSISPYVPWEIYKNTWYSVVCENGFTGDSFFLTEKTSKVMYAKRVFVLFGPCHFLRNLRELGFKTFDSIIDESYDNQHIDITRYRSAWNQMLELVKQDPVAVYERARPILEHNRQHMIELKQQTKGGMAELLRQHIPQQYHL